MLDLAPDNLAHVFFSDSGSTAVEVALKMALGYWRNTGHNRRTRILALEHAYHGDTIGTMSPGARGAFNAAYEPLLFEVGRVPFPSPGKEHETLDALEAECKSGTVAALLVEPLVLGAGGMMMYAPSVLARMREICTAHNVLLIADEVMTGFGRTGEVFACNHARIAPDIMCVAKGLTGGSIPSPRPCARPQSTTRTTPRIAARPSSIRVPTPPTRSPAQPRRQTSRSGAVNPFAIGSPRWHPGTRLSLQNWPLMPASCIRGNSAPSPP